MKRFTHLTAGALAGCAIASGESVPVLLLVCAVSAGGSLLPDMDIGTSTIARLCRPASYMIQLFLGHRGIFHSLLLWIVLSTIWYTAAPLHLPWIKAAACGVGTHLLLDMLNPAGVPLLWPIGKRIRIAGIPSGGIIDNMLGLVLLCIFLYQLSSIILPVIT